MKRNKLYLLFLLFIMAFIVCNIFVNKTICHVESQYIYSVLYDNKEAEFSNNLFIKDGDIVIYDVDTNPISLDLNIDNPNNINYVVDCSIVEDSSLNEDINTNYSLTFASNKLSLDVIDKEQTAPINEYYIKAAVSIKNGEETIIGGYIYFYFNRNISNEDFKNINSVEVTYDNLPTYNQNNNTDLYRSKQLLKISANDATYVNLNGEEFKAGSKYYIGNTNYLLYTNSYIHLLQNETMYLSLENIEEFKKDSNSTSFSIQDTSIGYDLVNNYQFYFDQLALYDDSTIIITDGIYTTDINKVRNGISSTYETYRYSKDDNWSFYSSTNNVSIENDKYVLNVTNCPSGCYKLCVFYINNGIVEYRVDKIFYVN